MSDIPITITGPAPAPVTYTLSPLEQWTPSSAVATFDGTGAASDFLPCCSIYSQTGALLGRMFPGTLHPGDVAEVTYSPFSRPQTTAAPASAQLGTYTSFNLNVPPGVDTLFPFVFDSGTPLLDLTTPTAPLFLADGTYIVRVECYPFVNATYAGAMARLVQWFDVFGGTNSNYTAQTVPMTAGSAGFENHVTAPWVTTAGRAVLASVEHNAGVNVVFTALMNVLKIG